MRSDSNRSVSVTTTIGAPSATIAVDLRPQPEPRDLPGPASLAWGDPDIARKIADWADRVLPAADHSRVHAKPQPGCPGCAPTPCRHCGSLDCPDELDHRLLHAGAEQSWREAAAS